MRRTALLVAVLATFIINPAYAWHGCYRTHYTSHHYGWHLHKYWHWHGAPAAYYAPAVTTAYYVPTSYAYTPVAYGGSWFGLSTLVGAVTGTGWGW